MSVNPLKKYDKSCVNYAFPVVAIKDYFEENYIFFEWLKSFLNDNEYWGFIGYCHLTKFGIQIMFDDFFLFRG